MGTINITGDGFNKDGTNKKGKFRFYCNHKNCKKYIMVKWGGGYASVIDEDGDMCDIRNQCWYCEKHKGKK